MPEKSITVLLQEWAEGSSAARDDLMPLIYSDLKTLSRKMLSREHHADLTATSLVHDLYLKLVRHDSMSWTDRRHFFSFCAMLMRQILTDLARARLSEKRGAPIVPLAGVQEIPWIGASPADYMDLNDAMDQLYALDAEKARVVELRLYMGCTAAEVAEVTGVSKATVDRHMNFGKAFLFRKLRDGG